MRIQQLWKALRKVGDRTHTVSVATDEFNKEPALFLWCARKAASAVLIGTRKKKLRARIQPTKIKSPLHLTMQKYFTDLVFGSMTAKGLRWTEYAEVSVAELRMVLDACQTETIRVGYNPFICRDEGVAYCGVVIAEDTDAQSDCAVLISKRVQVQGQRAVPPALNHFPPPQPNYPREEKVVKEKPTRKPRKAKPQDDDEEELTVAKAVSKVNKKLAAVLREEDNDEEEF